MIGTGERGTMRASPSAASARCTYSARCRSRCGQPVDLLQGRFVIRRLGDRHRLDRDGGASADRDVADHDLSGLPAREALRELHERNATGRRASEMTGGTTAGSADVDRIDDVAGQGEDPDDDEEGEHCVRQGSTRA